MHLVGAGVRNGIKLEVNERRQGYGRACGNVHEKVCQEGLLRNRRPILDVSVVGSIVVGVRSFPAGPASWLAAIIILDLQRLHHLAALRQPHKTKTCKGASCAGAVACGARARTCTRAGWPAALE